MERLLDLHPDPELLLCISQKKMITKYVLEFEEDDGVLHVKELMQNQVQADKNSFAQLLVPVKVNYKGLTTAQCERLTELLKAQRCFLQGWPRL